MSFCKICLALPAALSALVVASTVFAHVTLEAGEAPVGSYYKAVFRVGHGCQNSPTVRIRVQIPDGIYTAKPQPKAGWQVSTAKTRLAVPVARHHGTTVTEVVSEVTWSGGSLPDNFYDEFVVLLHLPDGPANRVIHFPVVQECAGGVRRWDEVPEAGKPRSDYHSPAPALQLTPRP